MTCPTPEPANLPDWFKTVLQDALPKLRTLRYDLEVYQPKGVFEKHAEIISKLINSIEAITFDIPLADQATTQDKDENFNLQDQFACLAMQSIIQAMNLAFTTIDYNNVAYHAYLMAKAMMRKRATLNQPS